MHIMLKLIRDNFVEAIVVAAVIVIALTVNQLSERIKYLEQAVTNLETRLDYTQFRQGLADIKLDTLVAEVTRETNTEWKDLKE